MTTSLSILLPVHNAEERLAEDVAGILDLLTGMAAAFDLVIVDDGSTDDTVDVARDLATQYPQINVIRHPVRLGLDESIKTGLSHATGETVFVGHANHGLDATDVGRLWNDRRVPGKGTKQRDHGDEIGARIARLIGRPMALAAARRSRSTRAGLAVQLVRIPPGDGGEAEAQRYRLDQPDGGASQSASGPSLMARIRRFALGA